uniref:ARAD1D42680p n=1 Tax=Blastobotrys adeninivorans TaxID=409370 RepID=A0A060TDC8_BLAAD
MGGYKAGLLSRTNTYGLSGRALRVAVTATAVTGFSLFGYDQGLMSGIITSEQFAGEFKAVGGTSQHSTVIQGAVTSCYEIGCFFGALFALIRGNRIGRRPLVIAGAIIIIIGTVISVAAFGPHWGLGQFVVGRVITGIGNGLNTATIPVWQSEMSRAENRGFLVNLEGSIIAVGTMVAYWIDFGLSYAKSSVSWRFPVAFQIFFAIFLLAGILGLPESPRWLLTHQRGEEARHILGALQNHGTSEEDIETEARVILEAVSRTGNQAAFTAVFQKGRTANFQRMLLGASTQFFQQFAGCNAAIYYSTVLFEQMGQTHRMALIMGGVFSIVYALFTIPSFFLIEKIGRRKLFLIGAAGEGFSFLITMACLASAERGTDKYIRNSKGAAVGLFLFICFFAFTILQLPWVYPPEINPNRTRTAATAISTCTNWIVNFAVVMFTPVFVNRSDWGCYLFFALMNFIWIPLIYFYYPETAGRSLEEMDIIFAKAFVEKKLPFRVAAEMPSLSAAEVEREAEATGLYEASPGASDSEKPAAERSSDDDEV